MPFGTANGLPFGLLLRFIIIVINEILQDAGVDMTTPAPIQATVAAMEQVMDQIEEILDRRGE